MRARRALCAARLCGVCCARSVAPPRVRACVAERSIRVRELRAADVFAPRHTTPTTRLFDAMLRAYAMPDVAASSPADVSAFSPAFAFDDDAMLLFRA